MAKTSTFLDARPNRTPLPPPPPPATSSNNNNNYGSFPATKGINEILPGQETPSPQQDRWISFVYALLGLGLMLPWNAFISANSYFQTRFCGVAKNVELWFGAVFNLFYTATLLVVLFVSGNNNKKKETQQQQDGGRLSANDDDDDGGGNENKDGAPDAVSNGSTRTPSRRQEQRDGMDTVDEICGYRMAMVPLSASFVVFCVTTALVPMTHFPAFPVWTMVGLALCGISTGVSAVGIMTSSVIYPVGIGMNPFSSGRAVGGVLVAVANFVATWMFGSTDCSSGGGGAAAGGGDRLLMNDNDGVCTPYRIDWGAFSAFLLGCVALVAGLVAFHVLHSSPVRQYYRRLQQQKRHSPNVGEDEEERLLTNHNHVDPESATVASVWRKVYLPVLAVYGTLFGTASIYPAWTSQIQSVYRCPLSQARIWNDLFTPLSFVLQTVGDLTGRLLSIYWVSTITSRQLLVGCTLRLVFFFPLFYAVHTSYTTSESFKGGDALSVALLILIGFSTGLLFSLVLGHYPTLVSTPQEQRIAASLISLAVASGIVSGSLFSFVYADLAVLLGI